MIGRCLGKMIPAGFAILAWQATSYGMASAWRKPVELARNGEATATLVVTAQPSAEAWFAAHELRNHLRQITGAEFRIVTDDVTLDGPRILVGESAATRALGLKSADFQPQEYLIQFRPDTLVLMGRDAQSPLPSRLHASGKAVYAEGRAGKALEFGTGLDAILVQPHNISDAAGTFDAWAWLEPAAPGDGIGTLFRLDGPSPWCYLLLQIQDNGVVFASFNSKGEIGNSVKSKPIARETWHRVTATYDAAAAKMELFVDGVSQGTAPYQPSVVARAPHLTIGAVIAGGDGAPGNKFRGRLDDIRVLDRARAPAGADAGTEDGTTLRLPCDDGAAVPTDASGYVYMPPPPDGFTAQGTCYAVYDFLERFCGVRWYAPGDDGTIIPKAPTLTVHGADIRRKPALEYRNMPTEYRDLPWGLVAPGSFDKADAALFLRRMRTGGKNYYTSHSFSSPMPQTPASSFDCYDRFWKQNPKRPEVFEGKHPEYFAQGYPDKDPPPQLCYTNPDFIAQIVKDSRAKLDAGAEYIQLGPEDNDLQCKCPSCQALMNLNDSNGLFMSGRASDLFYSFANKVAAELRKSHPDKFVAVTAYFDFARFPKKIDAIEPNILVGPCLSARNWWCPPMKENDLAFYHDWLNHVGGKRIHCVWIYQCFPALVASGKFKFFPGFHAHSLDEYMKMFHRDGVRGIALCGLAEYVDGYLTLRLLDNPDLKVESALDEFFKLYYGQAAEPMHKLYALIEKTYCDPANYPPGVRDPASFKDMKTGEKFFHQTEEMAWKWLGTQERMDRISALMAEARAANLNDVERRHLDTFDQSVYAHMIEGRKAWVIKEPQLKEVEELKKQPALSAAVPRVDAPANGDPAKLDWSKAAALKLFRSTLGYATDRAAAAYVAHDGESLRIKLEYDCETAALADGGAFYGDRWEVFVAKDKSVLPYEQIAISATGGQENRLHDGSVVGGIPWKTSSKVVAAKTANTWCMYVTIPLKDFGVTGELSGRKIDFNVFRGFKDNTDNLCWAPTFATGFHNYDRFGELTLE